MPLLANCGRAFLDNVVTSVLAPVSGAKWKEYAGGYTDWQRQRPAAAVQDKPAAKAPAHEKTPAKLTYKEQRELEALPGEIEGELVGELERWEEPHQ